MRAQVGRVHGRGGPPRVQVTRLPVFGAGSSSVPLGVRAGAAFLLTLLALGAAAMAWRQPASPSVGWLWSAAALGLAVLGLGAGPRWERRDLTLATAWFGAAVLVGLYGVDRLPLGLHGDESQHVLVASSIHANDPGFFRERAWGVPVPGFLWSAAWVGVLGPTVLAVRVASVVAGALTVAVTYLWGRELGGRWRACFAAGVLLTSHTHLMLSHLGTFNAQAILLVTATLWLLTVSWSRRSAGAGVLAAVFFALALVTWSGARIVVPVVFGGVVVAMLAGKRPELRRPLLAFALAVGLLLAGPVAYAAGPADGWRLFASRMDKSILHPAGWLHTVGNMPEPTVEAVARLQLGGTLSAFAPTTRGDRSSFYVFPRPIVDPATLALTLFGMLLIWIRRRRAWLWSLPALTVVGTLVSTTLFVDSPSYQRLAVMLPCVALFVACALEWVRVRCWRGHAVAVAAIAAVALLNVKWFYLDYPREGRGDYEFLALSELASRHDATVYVVASGFNFRHETLRLLDPQGRVRPPPVDFADAEADALWASVGPRAAEDVASIESRLPGRPVRVRRDNQNRIVLASLEPFAP